MSQPDPSTLLRFSLQRALVGEITARTVGVTAGLNGTRILVRAYFDSPVTDEDRERLSCVAAEVIADFPSPYTIDEECHWVGEAPVQMVDFWAFKRAEPSAQVA